LILLGGLAGAITGILGSIVTALVQITAKRMRNARSIRRGEPPRKDVVFVTLWPLLAIIGFVGGLAWTWHLDATWVTGAIAGAALPAVMSFAWLATALAQLRR
jgi:hypothetical protein